MIDKWKDRGHNHTALRVPERNAISAGFSGCCWLPLCDRGLATARYEAWDQFETELIPAFCVMPFLDKFAMEYHPALDIVPSELRLWYNLERWPASTEPRERLLRAVEHRNTHSGSTFSGSAIISFHSSDGYEHVAGTCDLTYFRPLSSSSFTHVTHLDLCLSTADSVITGPVISNLLEATRLQKLRVGWAARRYSGFFRPNESTIQDGASFMKTFLGCNAGWPKLEWFCLDHGHVSVDAMRHFITLHPQLETLNLSHCNITTAHIEAAATASTEGPPRYQNL